MSLPLSFLICLSVFNLCLATGPVEEVIKPKKAHLLGGWNEISPESKEVQKATQYGVEMYNNDSQDKELFKLVSITKAKSQITNNINFEIEAILGKTKCLKTQNLDIKSCDLDKEQVTCHFFVILNPHTDKHTLNTKSCNKVT